MNKRDMKRLEQQVAARAVDALNAAQRRAAESDLPRVMVLDGGLYRVSGSGAKELIRTLPARAKASHLGARHGGD